MGSTNYATVTLLVTCRAPEELDLNNYMSNSIFDKTPSLGYLGLSQNYEPSPENDPIAFLSKHLLQLPPHLLMSYTHITTPKQRTAIATIRNRRLHYANKNPPDLQFDYARITWPNLWQSQERQVGRNGDDERAWAQSDFLEGKEQFVGKLGNLLAAYEEERKSECIHMFRRSGATTEDDFVPEEDSDSDSDSQPPQEKETEEEAKTSFERLIREFFVYGRLENMDYDKIDWDESLGVYDDREAEDRWFDEDEDD